jgi:hypothetical protein
MKFLLRLFTFLSIGVLCAGAVSFAEDGASLESSRLYDTSAPIKNFLLVSEEGMLRFSLAAGSEKGIQSVEIYSSDKTISRKDCYGTKDCRIMGTVRISDLSTKVVTAVARETDGTEQREKVLLGDEGAGAKVYMVTSIPDLKGVEPLTLVAGAPSDATSAAGTVADIAAKPENRSAVPPVNKISQPSVKGPNIALQMKKNAPNDFSLKIYSSDKVGVDFIEILENGEFLDVHICNGKTECEFVKELNNRKPGNYKYLIKSMNLGQGLSFQEELLDFTE